MTENELPDESAGDPTEHPDWVEVARGDDEGDHPGGDVLELIGHIGRRWFYVEAGRFEIVDLGIFDDASAGLAAAAPHCRVLELPERPGPADG